MLVLLIFFVFWIAVGGELATYAAFATTAAPSTSAAPNTVATLPLGLGTINRTSPSTGSLFGDVLRNIMAGPPGGGWSGLFGFGSPNASGATPQNAGP